MRQYCADFDAYFRKIALEHTEKFTFDRYYDTYMVLFSKNRDDMAFGSLYVDNPEAIYYGDIWEIVGFDEVVFRKPLGKPWSRTEQNKFIKMLTKQLAGVAGEVIVKQSSHFSDTYLFLSVQTEDEGGFRSAG